MGSHGMGWIVVEYKTSSTDGDGTPVVYTSPSPVSYPLVLALSVVPRPFGDNV